MRAVGFEPTRISPKDLKTFALTKLGQTRFCGFLHNIYTRHVFKSFSATAPYSALQWHALRLRPPCARKHTRIKYNSTPPWLLSFHLCL